MTIKKLTEEYLDIAVTRIGTKWHCRLTNILTGSVLDEVACELKEDVGYCCYILLRWHDKCGGSSPMAMATRKRQKHQGPLGKVWHTAELERHKEKRKKGVDY